MKKETVLQGVILGMYKPGALSNDSVKTKHTILEVLIPETDMKKMIALMKSKKVTLRS